MSKMSLRNLTLAAVLAAVYAVMTVALPIPQYGAIQMRISEALTVLPFLFPAATPGLFVGCVIANLFSPYPLDVLCGSLATLMACVVHPAHAQPVSGLPAACDFQHGHRGG